MNLVSVRGCCAALLCSAALLTACSEPNALLLTVSAERQVTSFDFTVRDLATHENVAETKGQALPADQDISLPGKELKLAVRFLSSGTYLVHLVGRDATGTQVGARSYRVDGTVDAHLALVPTPAGGDLDGDGFPAAPACASLAAEGFDCAFADCDDNDPRVNPLAAERCNGRDDDCDGTLGDDETDGDADGYLACLDCDPSDETDFNWQEFHDCRDCDDARPDVHPASRRDPVQFPAATEDCTNCGDGVDHNCDGALSLCNDADCDGWPGCGKEGAPASPLCDCDDEAADVHPGATELCGDQIDNNCDGQKDEGCMPCDVDGDGFMRADPQNGCNPAAGAADCDDTDAAVFPGAAATCGGNEGGCRDMALRGYCHPDAQGRVTIHDCDNRPAPTDAQCPVGDPTCSGCPDPACDRDGDGFMRYEAPGCTPAAGVADCDDDDPHTFPGAPDRCGDGKAQNCNLDTACSDDADGDGYNSGDDCDDGNPAVHPWAPELCNGHDDDCDGVIDEGNPDASTGQTVAGTSCTDSDVGECAKREGACICSRLVPVGTRNQSVRHACKDEDVTAAASPRCFGAAQPAQETAQTCDGLDQDCDGAGDDVADEVPCATGTACKWTSSEWKCACDAGTGCSGCCMHASPSDYCIYVESVTVGQCGQAGEDCHTCNDTNVCTIDTCDAGVCHNANFQDHAGCPGGQCRLPNAGGAAQCCGTCWLGNSCAASVDAGCGGGGVDCLAPNTDCGTCRVCDGGGTCGAVVAGQDPNDQCGTETAATCGRTGVCDGAGACALYGAGTSCATCRVCNGAGSCGNVGTGLDPNNECTDEGGCGHDGLCNGAGACRYYPNTKSCGTCSLCNGSGTCSVMPADDTSCGTIDCSANNTTCRTYPALVTNRCKVLGSCKTAADCTVFNAQPITVRCGLPDPCKTCDGAGNCSRTPADDPACGTIDCDGLDATCRNYNDLNAARCGSFGGCKPPNQSTTCTDYVNAAGTTVCATCKTCDTGLCTANVPPGGSSSGACPDQGLSSCGTNGLCDGGGSCQYYSSGARCATCLTCAAHACAAPVANGTDPAPDCAACRVCDGAGGCRDATVGTDPKNNCTSQLQATCGRTGDCDGGGGCQRWPAGTDCGVCAECDGGGGCTQVPADDGDCGTIGCSALSTACRTYSDLTSARCKALSTCKGVNATDCTIFVDASLGDVCGTCHACDGNGGCDPVADGTRTGTCGNPDECCAGECCLSPKKCIGGVCQ